MTRWLAVMLLVVTGCASTGGVRTDPTLTVADLRTQMLAAKTPIQSYVAEARLTYFGPDGRVKGTATLALARPASLRYEIQGPHGGVIEAFATNGSELQLLDFKTNRYIYGPATPATIDQLLSFAPLGMGAEEWVDLLCGDLLPPENAEIDVIERRYRVRWEHGGLTRELYVDPVSARADRAIARRGDTRVSEVRVEGRGERGLPDRLQLEVPEAEVDMEIRLRDLTLDPELDAGVFRIEAPASAEKLYLHGLDGP